MIIKSKYLKREDIEVLADFLKLKMPSPNIEDKSLASSQVSKSQADIDKSQKLDELVDEQRKLSFSAEQHDCLVDVPLLPLAVVQRCAFDSLARYVCHISIGRNN
jgi:hypothetical protein